MKKLILALVIGSFLVGPAFAGLVDVHNAYKSRDYATAISEADKVIAESLENVTLYDKASAQRYKGLSLNIRGKYAEAIPEFDKVKNYPTERYQNASAEYYKGCCYEHLKDTVKAQASFLKVLTDYPEIWQVVSDALKKVNFVSMSDEEVQTILGTILRVTPATEKEAEFLGRVKSELEKFK